jgi:hypothetical protein
MATYSVAGFTGAQTVSDRPLAVLWNPSANKRIKLVEFGFYRAGTAGTGAFVQRTSTRGTVGSTVTPDADNAWGTAIAPPSGAVLDLAEFAAGPSANGVLASTQFASTTGTEGFGHVFLWGLGLMIPPGRGVMIRSNPVTISQCWVYAVWEEGC